MHNKIKMLVVFAIALACILILSIITLSTTNVKYDEQPVFSNNQQLNILGRNPCLSYGDDDEWDSDLDDDDQWV